MTEQQIIRIETDGECYVSFGDRKKPPVASRDKSFMISAGSVEYFAIPRKNWLHRLLAAIQRSSYL